MKQMKFSRTGSAAIVATVALVCGGVPAFCREPAMSGVSATPNGITLSATESAVIAKTNAAVTSQRPATTTAASAIGRSAPMFCAPRSCATRIATAPATPSGSI